MKIGDTKTINGQKYEVIENTTGKSDCNVCDLPDEDGECDYFADGCQLDEHEIYQKVTEKLKRYSVVFTSSKGVMRQDTVEAKSLLLAFFQVPAIIPDGFNNISIKEMK